MIVIECPQNSPEWFAHRAGVPSASCFNRIVTSKGEPSKQAEKYMMQLAGERITGAKEETYSNSIMQRGIEMEAEAREFYELVTGNTVKQVGLCYKDEAKTALCSPDGLIGDSGGLEIKCPTLAVHVSYLLGNKVPADYYQQIQGSLYVTGREWWDFMSYYPGMPPLIVRAERDPRFIAKLGKAIKQINDEIEATVKKLNSSSCADLKAGFEGE